MFASIRRYRLISGSMDDLTRRVDDGFADEVWVQPGFVSYGLIDCGEGESVTISLFDGQHDAEASREQGAPAPAPAETRVGGVAHGGSSFRRSRSRAGAHRADASIMVARP